MPVSSDTYLRRAERDDLDTVMRWMEEPDFQHFLYGDAARSPRQIREQIIQMLGRAVGHTMPGGIYLVLDSKQYGPIGLISLQNISWRNRSCTLDLYIGNQQLRSRHIGGLAIYRALEYCFDELNLHRVGSFIYAFNKPSWRTLEMTGAVREITMREHVARDGVLHDVYGYGLLRREFDAFREKHRRLEGISLQDMIKTISEGEAE